MKKIILIAGASGVGKDSVIKASRDMFAGNKNVHFIRRFITRKPNEHEDNVFMDKAEFDSMVLGGEFLSFWSANGNHYGILKNSLGEGVNILSVSRGVMGEIYSKYDNVVPVEITAGRETLRQRLISRGRESDSEVEERLNRYVEIDLPDVVKIDNSGSLHIAVDEFCHIVNKLLRFC